MNVRPKNDEPNSQITLIKTFSLQFSTSFSAAKIVCVCVWSTFDALLHTQRQYLFANCKCLFRLRVVSSSFPLSLSIYPSRFSTELRERERKCKYFRLISLISAGGMLVICKFSIGNSTPTFEWENTGKNHQIANTQKESIIAYYKCSHLQFSQMLFIFVRVRVSLSFCCNKN